MTDNVLNLEEVIELWANKWARKQQKRFVSCYYYTKSDGQHNSILWWHKASNFKYTFSEQVSSSLTDIVYCNSAESGVQHLSSILSVVNVSIPMTLERVTLPIELILYSSIEDSEVVSKDTVSWRSMDEFSQDLDCSESHFVCKHFSSSNNKVDRVGENTSQGDGKNQSDKEQFLVNQKKEKHYLVEDYSTYDFSGEAHLEGLVHVTLVPTKFGTIERKIVPIVQIFRDLCEYLTAGGHLVGPQIKLKKVGAYFEVYRQGQQHDSILKFRIASESAVAFPITGNVHVVFNRRLVKLNSENRSSLFNSKTQSLQSYYSQYLHVKRKHAGLYRYRYLSPKASSSIIKVNENGTPTTDEAHELDCFLSDIEARIKNGVSESRLLVLFLGRKGDGVRITNVSLMSALCKDNDIEEKVGNKRWVILLSMNEVEKFSEPAPNSEIFQRFIYEKILTPYNERTFNTFENEIAKILIDELRKKSNKIVIVVSDIGQAKDMLFDKQFVNGISQLSKYFHVIVSAYYDEIDILKYDISNIQFTHFYVLNGFSKRGLSAFISEYSSNFRISTSECRMLIQLIVNNDEVFDYCRFPVLAELACAVWNRNGGNKQLLSKAPNLYKQIMLDVHYEVLECYGYDTSYYSFSSLLDETTSSCLLYTVAYLAYTMLKMRCNKVNSDDFILDLEAKLVDKFPQSHAFKKDIALILDSYKLITFDQQNCVHSLHFVHDTFIYYFAGVYIAEYLSNPKSNALTESSWKLLDSVQESSYSNCLCWGVGCVLEQRNSESYNQFVNKYGSFGVFPIKAYLLPKPVPKDIETIPAKQGATEEEKVDNNNSWGCIFS